MELLDDRAGLITFDLIAQEIEAEKVTKTSFETRGLSVVTSSGAVLTLLLGLVSWVTQTNKALANGTAIGCVIAAVLLLMIATTVGILVNAPQKVLSVRVDALRSHLDDRTWNKPGDSARKGVAHQRIKQLASMRSANERRSFLLMTAVSAECGGFLAIAAAVIVVLLSQ